MPRRAIVAAMGALIGLAIWYTAVASLGLMPVALQLLRPEGLEGRHIAKWLFCCLVVCGFGGGALFLLIGEKLRLIPTQERMNDEARPPSLRSHGES